MATSTVPSAPARRPGIVEEEWTNLVENGVTHLTYIFSKAGSAA
ncbi:hypothetical protein [Streptomyces hokutonensis]